jgi:hypothetical protein
VTSPRSWSSVVSGCGSPPAAGTRTSPLDGLAAITMVSSSSQVAPRLRLTLEMASGDPPAIGTLRSSVGSA